MQEGQKRIIAARAPRPALSGPHPALGVELARVRAPELSIRVRRPRRDDDFGALGDEVAQDGRVGRGVAERERDGGVEAQSLSAHGVEVGHAVEDAVGHWGGEAFGDVLADFGAEFGLHVRGLAHKVDGPCEGTSRGFVAGGEEGHHVVDELVFGEGAGLQRDRDDVRGQVALRGEGFTF